MTEKFDYRKVFTDPEHGRMAGPCKIVNIDFTPTPSPFSPWPMRKVGIVTESLAKLHNKNCYFIRGCFSHGTNGAYDIEHVKQGYHDCRCPAWFKFLRAELKRNKK